MENKKMKYQYDGAVLVFDNVVAHQFTAQTYAVSKEKAANNIKWQVRKEGNWEKTVPIKLPGKLKIIN